MLFEATFDVDLFEHVAPAWIVSNVALGVVLLALGQWWSRRFVESAAARPWAKRFMEHLSGRSLRSATAFLG